MTKTEYVVQYRSRRYPQAGWKDIHQTAFVGSSIECFHNFLDDALIEVKHIRHIWCRPDHPEFRVIKRVTTENVVNETTRELEP